MISRHPVGGFWWSGMSDGTSTAQTSTLMLRGIFWGCNTVAEQDGAAWSLQFSSEKRWLEEYFPFENDNFSEANCQSSCGEFQYDETKKKEAIYLGDFGHEDVGGWFGPLT